MDIDKIQNDVIEYITNCKLTYLDAYYLLSEIVDMFTEQCQETKKLALSEYQEIKEYANKETIRQYKEILKIA